MVSKTSPKKVQKSSFTKSMDKLNLPGRRVKEMPARYYKRILFLGIDFLILLMIVYNPFSASLMKIEQTTHILDFNQVFNPHTYYTIYSITLITWLYFTIFQRYFKATPGMKVLGLRVTGNNTFVASFTRNLFAFPASFLIILWVIEPIYTFIKKQSLMEKLTGSQIVEDIAV